MPYYDRLLENQWQKTEIVRVQPFLFRYPWAKVGTIIYSIISWKFMFYCDTDIKNITHFTECTVLNAVGDEVWKRKANGRPRENNGRPRILLIVFVNKTDIVIVPAKMNSPLWILHILCLFLAGNTDVKFFYLLTTHEPSECR